jgi:hypothetical protein
VTDADRHPARRSEAAPVVSLREITEDNRAALEALAVTEDQNYYVASFPARCRGLSRR